ncbi:MULTISPECIES: hypothetical protein [Pseudomonas]|jgi:hypothetical protein|uniref:Uncharacterized protein n=1 Tax=Pseudomonas fluorescens TaxID=294 RepID=A0A0F4SST8_PSEFL|nr:MULTISPECIES: hypothetical protein [Pseudomonas]KJZ35253.1 hypothetical protein VC35_27340 [Pseudomonas fluorescens]
MSSEQTVVPLPPPTTVPAPLSNVVGGETNLLHRTAWSDPNNPLKVCFDPWENSQPSVGDPESVQILLNDVEIGRKEWTAPIPPSDLFVAISEDKLPSGVHELRYIVTIWSGTPHESDPLVITVDKNGPLLNPSSAFVFPSAVLPPNTLTARYLEQNNDEVKVDLPVYTTPRPWDCITWYWGETRGNLNKGGVIELDEKNYELPVVVTIEGQLIRDRKDGLRYAWYEVSDRAGNVSRPPSDPVELDVAATPIPRNLPWPTVEKASGAGEQQTLDPLLATTGAVVEIPVDAVIYPGERMWVQWGEPGTLGARRIEQPISPGQRRYQVDMQAVAAHIGKTLSVQYRVIDEQDGEHFSFRRQLQVQTIPSNRFEAVRCDGLTGGNLRYSAVAPVGARLTLAKWSLITTDQWIMITMTGVGTSGDLVFEAIRKRAITAQEVVGGIGFSTDIRVPKAFLNTLRRNAPLTGKVYLSFDGGQTWPPLAAPNFPLLQLTLVD